jgi:hypothetical protein
MSNNDIATEADARPVGTFNGQTVNIVVGTPVQTIQTRYQTDIAALGTLWGTTSVSATSAAQLQSAIADLTDLVTNGIVGPASPNNLTGPQVRSVVSFDMASQANDVLSSLLAVGYTPGGANMTAVMTQWKGLAAAGNILSATVSPSLDVMLQTKYLATANAQIFSQISQLNTSTSLNQNILNSLTFLQNIKDQIAAPPTPNPSSSALGLNSSGQYNSGDALVGTNGVFTVPASGATDPNSVLNPASVAPQVSPLLTSPQLTQLQNMPATLLGYIQQLATARNATDPKAFPPVPLPAAGSVEDTLINIVGVANSNPPNTTGLPTDFGPNTQTAAGGTGLTVYNWIIDGFNSISPATSSGAIQRNLTTGMTATENINDTLKTQMQNELFIYQEFYDSAGSIISSLNTAATSIARNVGS